ncbi:MAG: response regulator transcription factor [Bacteriovorax sp.]|nr:response regulator transcription factor [Bacteriovorax sp.]
MKTLVIEDDVKILEFLELGLNEAGFEVDQASDGLAALEKLRKNSYDIIILDVMLPRMDGLTLLSTMRSEKIITPVLILSAKKTLEERVQGLQLGGDDYLVKPFAFAELLARVQALIRRSTTTAPNAGEETKLTYGDLVMDLEKREVFRQGKKISLQVKEFSLLDYFMRNPGRVITKALILEKVWGYDFDPQTNVVDVLVCRLRNKVDKDFNEKIIQTHRGVGYVLKQD